MPPHYIAVEGPIGVGKTTVVERLAERLEANLVLEDWGTNPFLRSFYEGAPGAAFQLELFFLLLRYRQQQELVQRQLFAQATLCDYAFEKSRLFAYLNLDDSELLIYEKLFSLLADGVPRPDLVVYLQASTPTLLDRIARRGRPYEKDMDAAYIALLNESYDYFFFHYDATPLLVVDTNPLDFVSNAAHRDDLLERIEDHPGGTVYYRPLREEA